MFRNTSQRQRIRAAFARLQRPLSISELQTEETQIGIATLYRTVEGLLEEGFLSRLELPGRAVRYELASCSSHTHFQCRSCGLVYCLSPIELALPSCPRGFQTDRQEVFVKGLCSNCILGE